MLIIVMFLASAGLLHGVEMPATPASYAGLEMQGNYPAEILSLAPPDGTYAGATIRLKAFVRNISASSLPADAVIWFSLTEDNWVNTKWVGNTSVAGLQPNVGFWASCNWVIPTNAPQAKVYKYTAQVWTASLAISEKYILDQRFNVTVGKTTVTSPSGKISPGKPTYSWKAVSTATWYQLEVLQIDVGIAALAWYSAADAGCSSGSGTCSATASVALPAGKYFWAIQAMNDVGPGPWSDLMDLTVGSPGPPGKATLVSPTGAITTTTPTYIWNAVADSTSYQIWVNDVTSPSGKIKKWYTAAEVGCSAGTGTCSLTPSTALTAGACTWWVQTLNDAGDGPWSDGMPFTIAAAQPPGKVTLISPNGTISTSRPTYTWNALSTATWYLLYVQDSTANPKINTWYKASAIGCASSTGTCSVTPATDLAVGAVKWWIQTFNDAGYGAWSDPISFTYKKTIAAAPNE